jgi:phage major head subunit gpT-like protein
MDINYESLSSIRRTMIGAFQEGLGFKPPEDLAFLFRNFPSTSESNFYPFLHRIPAFREWFGDRVFNNVRSGFYELKNRHFEDSVSMPSDAISDDKFGTYAPLVQMMAEGWPLLADYEIVVEVLTTNALCFDGKLIFATDHKYGDNTVANLVADALTATTFEAGFTAAAGWKGADNKYLRTRWTHLFHGPSLHNAAWDIVDCPFVASDGVQLPNRNFKRVQRVEMEDFCGAYASYWCLADCSRPFKPIARQLRQVAAPLMDLDPATVMRLGRVDIMADGRVAAGPTFPHLMYAGRP